MKKQFIELKGVKVHNLKNFDLKIELNKLIVITGVSGSGKSSLAFDTLYAEGQRRYVESLSSYARQFLGRLNKPECDYIKGIPPAIAIEQKVNTSNPRSTVGTSTEIYDYIKLLYARAAKIYSPISGNEVKRDSIDSIMKFILENHDEQTLIIMSKPQNLDKVSTLEDLLSRVYIRLKYQDRYLRIEDLISDMNSIENFDELYLVIDRININHQKDTIARISESIEIAMSEGDGLCYLDINGEISEFSNKLELDGIKFETATVNTFSFNSPIGACAKCGGYGRILGIDENLVIPNKSLSVYEGAVVCWRGEKMNVLKQDVINNAHRVNFPIHTPYYELTDEQKHLLWYGCKYFHGIYELFEHLESQKYKIQNRVMIARYTGKTVCPECKGTRLKAEASYFKLGGKSLPELVDMNIEQLKVFFENIQLDKEQSKIAARILPDILSRLNFLIDVGLSYLTLNRLSSTLSGGESQRINLATSLGSALVGSLYILDEPSIGLHSKDTERLISVLKKLRDLGNTVIVVEHDEDIIKAADEIIDIGPYAGRKGGELVFQGNLNQLMQSDTLTAKYMNNSLSIAIPLKRRTSYKKITISGATENNLKNITIDIPLNVMTAITGVSGSGKSTLVKNIIVPALYRELDISVDKIGSFDKISGDIKAISAVEYIDQNPIGKSSRSNPVTYLKVWDDIRKLYSSLKKSVYMGFKPAHFSFNVPGGRCEECQGEGIIKVEMQFMADVYLVCEHCKGKRFKDDVLEIRYKDKNIYDILEMTVNQALEFFNEKTAIEISISKKLQKLVDVGLGYIKLGQSSSTLSGGESQRIKLAYHLSLENETPTLFVFDEPTTGLHFYDIDKLMQSMNSLLSRGHTILIIEHNMDVIKCVDNIIDLGPEGGINGGYVLFQGRPEDLIKQKQSYTARYLEEKLQKHKN